MTKADQVRIAILAALRGLDEHSAMYLGKLTNHIRLGLKDPHFRPSDLHFKNLRALVLEMPEVKVHRRLVGDAPQLYVSAAAE